MNTPPEEFIRVPAETLHAFVCAAARKAGLQAAREREYREKGVPVGRWHLERLEELAGEMGLTVPWK